MKKTSIALMVAALLLVGAGCSDRMTNGSSYGESSTNNTGADTQNISVTQVAVGDNAVAGAVTHQVTLVEKMQVIPTSATIERFKSIEKEKRASEGSTFIHVKGKTTNTGTDKLSIDASSIRIVDEENTEYKFSTDVTMYIPEERFPTYLELMPGETKEWEAYFEVPEGQAQYKLKLTDLLLLPKSEVFVRLEL